MTGFIVMTYVMIILVAILVMLLQIQLSKLEKRIVRLEVREVIDRQASLKRLEREADLAQDLLEGLSK